MKGPISFMPNTLPWSLLFAFVILRRIDEEERTYSISYVRGDTLTNNKCHRRLWPSSPPVGSRHSRRSGNRSRHKEHQKGEWGPRIKILAPFGEATKANALYGI